MYEAKGLPFPSSMRISFVVKKGKGLSSSSSMGVLFAVRAEGLNYDILSAERGRPRGTRYKPRPLRSVRHTLPSLRVLVARLATKPSIVLFLER